MVQSHYPSHYPIVGPVWAVGVTTEVHDPSSNNWLSLGRAAEILDVTPDALRKRLERLAKKSKEGMIVCPLQDGIEARKLGKLWKLRLPGWR